MTDVSNVFQYGASESNGRSMGYEELRHFADSWGLLLLALIFLTVLIWVARPGARRGYSDQADIPFKHDDRKD